MRHTLLKLPHELIGSILHVMRRGILPSLLLAGKAEREAKLALIPGPSYPPIFASSSCSPRQALTQSICLAYLFPFLDSSINRLFCLHIRDTLCIP